MQLFGKNSMKSYMSNNNIPIERSYTLLTALKRARELLKQLNLEVHVSTMGTTVKTAYCCLYKNEELVAEGCGKGIGREAIVGALYEAIEHYHTEFKRVIIPIQSIKIKDIIKNDILLKDKAINLLAENFNEKEINCRKYTCSITGETIFYPVFLTFPSSISELMKLDNALDCYAGLFRYSTNSGTAIGGNFKEAIIHAINEIIERDALSIFLIKTFLSEQCSPINLINQETLPESEKYLLKNYQDILNDKILLIDCTSDLKVPTICAALAKKQRGVQPSGFGTSLSKSHALKRALSELLQVIHMNDEETISLENNPPELDKIEKLKNCAFFNIHDHIKDGYSESKKWDEVSSFSLSPNLDDYFLLLIKTINEKGYSAFFTKNLVTDNGIEVVNVIIPGLEKFNIIMSGNIVLPSNRGMLFFKDSKRNS